MVVRWLSGGGGLWVCVVQVKGSTSEEVRRAAKMLSDVVEALGKENAEVEVSRKNTSPTSSTRLAMTHSSVDQPQPATFRGRSGPC